MGRQEGLQGPELPGGVLSESHTDREPEATHPSHHVGGRGPEGALKAASFGHLGLQYCHASHILVFLHIHHLRSYC